MDSSAPHFFFKLNSEPPDLDILTAFPLAPEPIDLRGIVTRLEQILWTDPPEASPPGPEYEAEP
jgi:hypothetical protein